MAMVKLNVFHWHITDSHSWPIQIKSHSYLSDYGAYEDSKFYTAVDISEVMWCVLEFVVYLNQSTNAIVTDRSVCL